MTTNTAKQVAGNRVNGFSTTHGAAIAGSIIAGLTNYAEGSSLLSVAVGTVVGAGVGYAYAELLEDAFQPTAVASKTIAGVSSGMFGLSVSAMATGMITSISKLGHSDSE